MDNNDHKSEIAKREENILKFWQDNNIFEKSQTKSAPKGEFVFYDGPPFATGEPHYGHVVPGTIKDIIPRYKTMNGFSVRRRWGWDCHGLPVENIVEKDLNLKSKKDIVDYGIEKFNEMARSSVMRYADDWRKIIPRLGRWVDMENDYRTMDTTYTESVWWAFAELYKKGLVYEGFKSMNLCPRCETTLSNFEVTQGYKDITDISVFVKFKLLTDPSTFLIAWTTTPWTLPGNVALAVNPEVEYIKIKDSIPLKIITEPLSEGVNPKPEKVEFYNLILSKERYLHYKDEWLQKKILNNPEEVEVILGKDLIGQKYQPVFDYYVNDEKVKNKAKAWQVYGAEFVTTTDGTGVVHIAPAFGADDYDLAVKNNLPVIHHVTTSGIFKPEVTHFAGQLVKPKDNHQQADIEIIKFLAGGGNLFAKEKIIHSYPHCWRCETPLLNYASSSWFVKVTDFKDKLVKANEQVEWVPVEVGEGRFGNWLLGARDWAISRSRFWGAPLPVWKCAKCEEVKVVGSISDLKSNIKSVGNTLFLVRHGQSEANVLGVINDRLDIPSDLTEVGKGEVTKTAGEIKTATSQVDYIFTSPFARTKQTAEIIAKELGIPTEKIIVDDRLREASTGSFTGKTWEEFARQFKNRRERFNHQLPGAENGSQVRGRVMEFVLELDTKYQNKKIVIVSHGLPLFLLVETLKGSTEEDFLTKNNWQDSQFKTAGLKIINPWSYPHNHRFELDLHRPYIDNIKFSCGCGGEMTRIPEVFDCWFESGSMPFGEAHYPFNQKEFNPVTGVFSSLFKKSKGYPADFIAEGLDQTRGWFYSMLVLGVALFGKSPYKRVVVNGLVLAEDGQKMSKSKKNYPDLRIVLDKYGADALRYFLMSSPVVKGQDVVFSEKGVDEVVKKHIGRLNNVVSFYQMYAQVDEDLDASSNHPLDLWIKSRLAELHQEITTNLDRYEIDRAIRPIAQFIDDLSTWYIRRSRDRFKSSDVTDRNLALATTRQVLVDLTKLIAPFMPFLAEDIFQMLRTKSMPESVHLADWPVTSEINKELLAEMTMVRHIVSVALEARSSAGIKVRQPLALLKIKLAPPKMSGLEELIKDEVNVKKIEWVLGLEQEVELDTNITTELKDEGLARDLIRAIQERRKEQQLEPKDQINLKLQASPYVQGVVEKFTEEIKTVVGATDIMFATTLTEGEMVKIEAEEIKISF